MAAEIKPLLTPAEYLAFERESETKHEYVAGETTAMAGASRRHNLIVSRTVTSLNNSLAARPCEVYASDMRVKIGSLGIYTYPDIAAVCEEPMLEDAEQDTLLNPAIIIEVLSPSTARYDHDLKFRRYQLIPSLRHYLLIAQDEPRVAHYTISRDGELQLRVYRSLASVVDLPTLGCRLPLAEIYARITF